MCGGRMCILMKFNATLGWMGRDATIDVVVYFLLLVLTLCIPSCRVAVGLFFGVMRFKSFITVSDRINKKLIVKAVASTTLQRLHSLQTVHAAVNGVGLPHDAAVHRGCGSPPQWGCAAASSPMCWCGPGGEANSRQWQTVAFTTRRS